MPQTIPKDSVFTNNELGRHVYVWSKNRGSQSHDHAIISAHGKTLVSAPKKAKTDVLLTFYARQDYIQGGVADLRMAVEGRFQSREDTTVNSLAKDYGLSKYQGRHQPGNQASDEVGENYAYIAKYMHDVEDYYKIICKVDAYTAAQWASNYKGNVNMDVITLRNRVFGEAPTFTELVQMLQKKGYNYTRIHCSFCRGKADGTNLGQDEPIIRDTSIFD